MIGELARRLALQEELRVADGCGGFTASWNEVALVWGLIVAVGGREIVPEAERRSRVTIRWRGGVSPSQRFVSDGRIFEIEAVRDPDGRARFLVCDCVEKDLV